jgi:hypothetical protein
MVSGFAVPARHLPNYSVALELPFKMANQGDSAHARMDHFVRVDIVQWNGAHAGRASGVNLPQDREFSLCDAVPPHSADVCGSPPNQRMSMPGCV